MTPRFRKSIWVLGGAALLFAGIYLLARPNWRLVSEAEFQATMLPELTAPEPSDPAAQRRYDRFVAVLRKLGYTGEDTFVQPPGVQKAIERYDPVIRRLEEILAEGPLQPSRFGYQHNELSPIYGVDMLAVRFSAVARLQALNGDREAATRNYGIALRLVDELPRMACHWFDLSTLSTTYVQISDDLLTPPVRFSEPQLAVLARAISPHDKGERDRYTLMRRTCRSYLGYLQDPVGWLRQGDPTIDPEQTLADYIDAGLPGVNSEAVPTYDARETLAHFNRLVPAFLANTKRSYRDLDRSLDGYVSQLIVDIPENGAAGKEGFTRWWKRMEYRWVTARKRNAVGDRLVAEICAYGESVASPEYFTGLTFAESMRTRLALHRYRLRHGRSAPRLKDLVREGFLLSLPTDPYDGNALRYDARRKILWSVNQDLIDQNGRDRGNPLNPPSDLVWSTP